MDVVDAATRSRMMAGIRGTDTKPERVVRSGLHALGYRFRLHDKSLPGRPDLVLKKWHAVIFVNGCFWHAHQGCSFYHLPASNTEFWRAKLEGNAERDQRNTESIRSLGWRVAVVWECGLRHDPAAALAALDEWLRGNDPILDYPSRSWSESSRDTIQRQQVTVVEGSLRTQPGRKADKHRNTAETPTQTRTDF